MSSVNVINYNGTIPRLQAEMKKKLIFIDFGAGLPSRQAPSIRKVHGKIKTECEKTEGSLAELPSEKKLMEIGLINQIAWGAA